MLQTGVFLNDKLRSVGIKSGWLSLHFTNEKTEAEEHNRCCGGSPKLKNAIMVWIHLSASKRQALLSICSTLNSCDHGGLAYPIDDVNVYILRLPYGNNSWYRLVCLVLYWAPWRLEFSIQGHLLVSRALLCHGVDGLTREYKAMRQSVKCY